jgi:A118 family predicted phage portal protein
MEVNMNMWQGIKNKLGRWMGMLFGKHKKLQEIVKTQVSEEHYKLIEKWKGLYAGFNEELHQVRYTTLEGVKKRRMKSLNMPKVVSQELAKIIFTERVNFTSSDKTFETNLDSTLEDNRFYKVFQSKLEQMFALGGLVLKAVPKQKDDGTYKLIISYVTPDAFIPISHENGEVYEGVFLKITRKENKTYCLFEFHKWEVFTEKDDDGLVTVKKVYTITNELYEQDQAMTDEGKRVDLSVLYPELQEVTYIENLTQPLFQSIKPNIANNFDLHSPMGISIFANSVDTLMAIDTAFDSFIHEFKMGRRRIIVPASAIKTVIDPTTGRAERYFDASDDVYQAFNMDTATQQGKIQDNTVDLRIDEHIAGINALLNLLAMQIGFSTGTFTFDGQGIKTATEVVSEQSKTYQTKQVNEQLIEEGLRKFFHTIGEVAELYEIFPMPAENYELEVQWDDTIVRDKYTDADFYIKLKTNGLCSAEDAIMKILDVTEADAKKMVEKIRQENQSMNPDITDLMGGGFE